MKRLFVECSIAFSFSPFRSEPSKPAKINFRESLTRVSITDRVGDGMEALNAFIVGLYQETFNLVISLVNRYRYSFTSNICILDAI